MEYSEFLNYIKIELHNFLEDIEDIEIVKISKNNNIILDALILKKSDSNIAPIIYLKKYYEYYIDGMSIEEILDNILKEYKSNDMPESVSNFDSNNYGKLSKMKNEIIIRLVNYNKNKELLKNCPYIKFNDLAITFRWLAYYDEIGIGTTLITNEEFLDWGISLEELREIALSNTKKFFKFKLEKIEDVIKRKFNIVIDEENYINLYVLTNEQYTNGATVLLYEDVLNEFSKSIDGDFYILPSSIHEVILVPKLENIKVEYLLELVKEANNTVISDREYLSENVYLYDRNLKIISIV